MGIVTSLAATGAAIRRAVTDQDERHVAFAPRPGVLQLYADLYADTDHEPGDARYDAYRRQQKLPLRYRTIYNPTSRCVDFYPPHCYPGGWHMDGRPAPDGRPNRLWFPADLFEALPDLPPAVMQALDWANGAAMLAVYVRTAATFGSALLEVVDRRYNPDTGQAGKAYPVVTDPRDVADLDLSDAGHVRSYTLAYRALDPRDGKVKSYRKDVDRMTVRVSWDDKLVSEEEHGYGFCPAAWVKFFDAGGDWGVPAVGKAVRLIQEINRILAPADDWIVRFVDQPMVFWTDATFGKDLTVFSPDAGDGGGPSGLLKYLKGPKEGRTEPLMAVLPIEGVGGQVDRLVNEVEANLPEIVFSRELRAMSQVTAPGAARLMADAAGRLDEAVANLDSGLVKAAQMCLAVAGERLRRGDWGPASRLTRQQQKFRPFSLTSYAEGSLDFGLVPRPLILPTTAELIAEAVARESIRTPTGLGEIGYSDDDIYGDAGPPAIKPGILAERQEAQQGVAAGLGRLFDGGQL